MADALEVLVDAQLLQSPAPDRYRFHDLLKTYAAERALAEEPALERKAAVDRVLNWYLHTTVAMARLVSPHRGQVPIGSPGSGWQPLSFGTVEEALNWCEAERGNLLAAPQQAADWGMDVLAWQLPVAALSFFNRRSYRTEWVRTHEVALASVRRTGDRSAEAWVLNNLGMVHGKLRRPDAIEYFEQALAIRREIGDEPGEAQAANNIADTYLLLGRYEALEPLQEALGIQRRTGHRYGEAVALTNLGEAYLHLARTDEAVGCLQQARDIFRALDDVRGEGYALHHLGRALLDLGQVPEALDTLAQALRIREATGERLAEAQTRRLLGLAQQAAGRMDECRRSWSRAISLFEALEYQPQADEIRAEMVAMDMATGC